MRKSDALIENVHLLVNYFHIDFTQSAVRVYVLRMTRCFEGLKRNFDLRRKPRSGKRGDISEKQRGKRQATILELLKKICRLSKAKVYVELMHNQRWGIS